jgi:thiosulfate/3-mercaptopyruvate sulfurtransferase
MTGRTTPEDLFNRGYRVARPDSTRSSFRGEEPEPRPGVRPGHMPGALNTHYAGIIAEDGTLKEAEAIRERFESAKVDLERPIITTCGSGISAAILALGLARIGRDDVAVYDGSWAEWGSSPDTPVATGA